MVQQYEHWAELNVGAKTRDTWMFHVGENQLDFKITIKSNVSSRGHDLNYYLCSYEDYQIYSEWKKNPYEYKRDSSGNIAKTNDGISITRLRPFPKIHLFLNLLTNQIEKTLSLNPGTYVIIFDNTHSTWTSKSIWLHVIESWDHDTLSSNLPLIEQLVDELPPDVTTCIIDANDCYKVGHYNQCSIMLRKAIEIACKIKLLQSKTKPSQLVDNDGYEISLSKKIKLLQKKNLITQRNLKDLEHVKWFGDQSAHGSMQIALDDIKDTIEPRIRSFLVGLNLKV